MAGIGGYLFSIPSHWCLALVEIPTLAPKKWIGGALMDFYLTYHFTTLIEPTNVVYLPFTFTAHNMVINDSMRATYQQFYTREALQGKAIVFVLFQRQHYFVVLFDYHQGISVTYGRQWSKVTEGFTPSEDWGQWNGPHMWNRIADLLDLLPLAHRAVGLQPPTIKASFQWNQVSKTL